jgi:hypothetical protein
MYAPTAGKSLIPNGADDLSRISDGEKPRTPRKLDFGRRQGAAPDLKQTVSPRIVHPWPSPYGLAKAKGDVILAQFYPDGTLQQGIEMATLNAARPIRARYGLAGGNVTIQS